MVNRFFDYYFPEVAKAETRSLHIVEDLNGLPPGEYGFVESYCTDPKCDCRRVLLHVLRPEEGMVAVVSYGFDPGAPMRGPFLDPLHPRPAYGEALLKAVREVLLADPAYLARLERHYTMVKQKVAGADGPRPWWKKPKKPKRRRGWAE